MWRPVAGSPSAGTRYSIWGREPSHLDCGHRCNWNDRPWSSFHLDPGTLGGEHRWGPCDNRQSSTCDDSDGDGFGKGCDFDNELKSGHLRRFCPGVRNFLQRYSDNSSPAIDPQWYVQKGQAKTMQNWNWLVSPAKKGIITSCGELKNCVYLIINWVVFLYDMRLLWGWTPFNMCAISTFIVALRYCYPFGKRMLFTKSIT